MKSIYTFPNVSLFIRLTVWLKDFRRVFFIFQAMVDPESLNSLEVLAHLKQLGYDNITNDQLTEFMHDLKKLIKYEQKYGRSAPSVDSCNGSNESFHSACSYEKNECKFDTGDSSNDSSELCSNCNMSKTDHASDVISVISSQSDSDIRRKKTVAFGQQLSKPQSSFIRPWRLQPSSKGSAFGTSLKSDPVQLYHKYKELWSQQKVPGEKSHSQLRWIIREKMLGQDPQPRFHRPHQNAAADQLLASDNIHLNEEVIVIDDVNHVENSFFSSIETDQLQL